MHGFLKLATTALAALPFASAAVLPVFHRADAHTRSVSPRTIAPGQGQAPMCDISQAILANEVPAAQSAIIPPSSATLAQVTIGLGTQNYTCTSGKYVSAGALAQVFDISCIQALPAISAALADGIHELQTSAPGSGSGSGAMLVSFLEMTAQMAGFKLADHYFDTSSGPLAPVFNFAVSGGGFVIGKKVVDLPAPMNPQENVDWLQLTNAGGNAANFVVREQTAGGQPPASCDVEGESLQVPYAAKYWFFD